MRMGRINALVSVGALVALPLGKACYYSALNLENPYDFYQRYYCAAQCTSMQQSDSNYDACCRPLEPGTTAPGSCYSLHSTTSSCVWDGTVPTGDFPTSYNYGGGSSVTSGQASQATSTNGNEVTVWVTSTTAVPCPSGTSSLPDSTSAVVSSTPASSGMLAESTTSVSPIYSSPSPTASSPAASPDTSVASSADTSSPCDSSTVITTSSQAAVVTSSEPASAPVTSPASSSDCSSANGLIYDSYVASCTTEGCDHAGDAPTQPVEVDYRRGIHSAPAKRASAVVGYQPVKREAPSTITTTLTTTANQTFTFCSETWNLGQPSLSGSSPSPTPTSSSPAATSSPPAPASSSSAPASSSPNGQRRRDTQEQTITITQTLFPTVTCSQAAISSAPSGAKCYCPQFPGHSMGEGASATGSAPLVSSTDCTSSSCAGANDAPTAVVSADYRRKRGDNGNLVECDCASPNCVSTVLPSASVSAGTGSSSLVNDPSCASGSSSGWSDDAPTGVVSADYRRRNVPKVTSPPVITARALPKDYEAVPGGVIKRARPPPGIKPDWPIKRNAQEFGPLTNLPEASAPLQKRDAPPATVTSTTWITTSSDCSVVQSVTVTASDEDCDDTFTDISQTASETASQTASETTSEITSSTAYTSSGMLAESTALTDSASASGSGWSGDAPDTVVSADYRRKRRFVKVTAAPVAP